jgi:protein gp37
LQGAFSNEEIGSVFGVAAACPQHIFQILTKRDERLVKWFKWIAEEGKKLPGRVGEPCPSTSSLEASACVMLAGVAVIPQRQFVDACNESPWPLPNVWVGVSVESPDYLHRVDNLRMVPAAVRFLSLEPLLADLGTINLDGIGWVIVGGESGPGARSMKPEWVRAIRAQCEAEGVPFFFKQWGGLLKKKTGRLLDGRTYDGMP